jgi:FlaG/FlaF family flagellin (archaellin)
MADDTGLPSELADSADDGNGADAEGSADAGDGSNNDDGTDTALLLVGAVVAVVVFGVLAIVAVVVGSAVIGSFVLGLEDAETTTPQIQFEFEEAPDGVRIAHAGGEAVSASALVVSVDGAEWDWTAVGDEGPGDVVRAGDRVSVSAPPGATIQVLWRAEGEEAVLGVFEVEETGTAATKARRVPIPRGR